MLVCMCVCVHKYMYLYKLSLSHTHTQTHTRKHTHLHTHTHTGDVLSLRPCLSRCVGACVSLPLGSANDVKNAIYVSVCVFICRVFDVTYWILDIGE
jgi:hypothetical protein